VSHRRIRRRRRRRRRNKEEEEEKCLAYPYPPRKHIEGKKVEIHSHLISVPDVG
jgi:hypothetical protein